MAQETDATGATAAVARINAEIRACDVHKCGDGNRGCMVAAIKAMDRSSSGQLRVKLGECSETDWNTYLTANASDRALVPQCLSWEDGMLCMVECGATVAIASKFIRILEDAVKNATGTGFHDLQSHGDAFVDVLGCAKLMPSFSFGPAEAMRALGTQLPSGLTQWSDFHTIKGEVGAHRDWEELDQCAEAWQEYPGVKYVLCIRLSPRSSKHESEYKFHAINRNASAVAVVPKMPPVDPMPIDGPATYVTFDAHHALGLSAVANLPEGFSSQITIDLYAVMQALAQQDSLMRA